MWNVELDPFLLERDTKVRRDRLGILPGDVQLLRGRIVAVLEPGDCRKRQLVGDARVVDVYRCGKETIADDAVSARRKRGPKLVMCFIVTP